MSETTYYKTVNDKMYTIKPIKEICEVLEIKFKDQEQQIEYWEERFNNIINNDKEYQKLKTERDDAIKNLQNGFGIYDDELKKIDEWKISHNKVHDHKNHSYSYEFIPTSLGIIGYIKCSCGKTYAFRELN